MPLPFLKKRHGDAHHDTGTDAAARNDAAHGARAAKGNTRDELVIAIGEFVGTTLFIFFACGGVHAGKMLATSVVGPAVPDDYQGEGQGPGAAYNTSNLMYIAASTAWSYAILLWIFYRITPGLFNPAITIGLAVAGWMKPARLLYLIPVQMLGSIAGAGLIAALTPGDFHALTVITADIEYSRATFLEVFGTSLIMLAVLFLATERRRSSHLAHIGIGIAYWIALLTVTFWTGGSLNPVRSFGPAVIMTSFPGYHWIYWVGPITGAFIAATFYRTILFLGYHNTAHPDHSAYSGAHHAGGYGANTGDGANTGYGADVGGAGAGAGYGADHTAGTGAPRKASFFNSTAARDQSAFTSGVGSGGNDNHGWGNNWCSSSGNYHNRAGIGAGPEHTGLSHHRGDGAVHDNTRHGGLTGGRGDEEKNIGGGVAPGAGIGGQDNTLLLARLDRIESLLLHQPGGNAGAYQRGGVVAHSVARPSQDGTLYEGEEGMHGHEWKGTKTVV